MRTLELFAGIGGFRLAAEAHRLRTVWANDLCPQACAVYRSRFGDRELRQGDIAALAGEAPEHDLLTAGFPCQPFSSAGKKMGIRDPRGTLFQAIIDLLRRHQPHHFILENVKRLLTMERGFHFATLLAALADLNYHIEWRLLNAMHFGLPQNRQRVFLLGTHTRVPAPAFRVRMATAADLRTAGDRVRERLEDRSAWTPIEAHGRRFPNWGLAREGRFLAADLLSFAQATPPRTLRSVLQDDVAPDFDFTETTLGWLSANTAVNRFVQGVEILSNQGGGARMGYTIFGIDGVAPTLTSTTSRHYERYRIGDRYRRLTNVEYARIQGFPDDYCQVVPLHFQYALLGNAVPPPMAGWAIARILDGDGS
jgi:DNA (cytosine-5)-methyltransferase 1